MDVEYRKCAEISNMDGICWSDNAICNGGRAWHWAEDTDSRGLRDVRNRGRGSNTCSSIIRRLTGADDADAGGDHNAYHRRDRRAVWGGFIIYLFSLILFTFVSYLYHTCGWYLNGCSR